MATKKATTTKPAVSRPKINEQFWYDYSEKIVLNTVKNLDESYDKLIKLLFWAVTFYTGSIIFKINYSKIDDTLTIVILGFPYFALIVGYGILIICQYRSNSNPTFYAQSADSIEEFYKETVSERRKKLNYAQLVTFIATVVLAGCLFLGFTVEKTQTDKSFLNIQKQDNKLLMTGQFPKEKMVNLIFQKQYGKDSVAVDNVAFKSHKSGQFYYNYEFDSTAFEINVKAIWEETLSNKQHQNHSIEQTIKTKNK